MSHLRTPGQDASSFGTFTFITGRHSTISQHAVVLDLDETLVHTMPEGSEALLSKIMGTGEYLDIRGRLYQFILSDTFVQKGTGLRSHYWGLKRPHLNLFLAFCYSYFKYLVIWSAGQEEYVHRLTEILFEGIGRPDAVYTFKHCIPTKNGSYHKPLSLIINDSRFQGQLRPDNTFFVDDRIDNFLEHKSNAIVIPKYERETLTELASDDPTLLQLRQWLLQPSVVESRDVRTLEKWQIFTQPPLPPVIPLNVETLSWNFLSPLLSVTSPLGGRYNHYYIGDKSHMV